jgi:hypothetical protein
MVIAGTAPHPSTGTWVLLLLFEPATWFQHHLPGMTMPTNGGLMIGYRRFRQPQHPPRTIEPPIRRPWRIGEPNQ